jgi:small GTP-binding protein
METQRAHKVVLIGNPNAGKTCLQVRMTRGGFGLSQSTVVSNAVNLPVNVPSRPGVSVILNLWDTPGQQTYRNLTKLQLRGSKIALLCHAPDDHLGDSEDAFNIETAKTNWSHAVANWTTALSEVTDGCQIVLVTTKGDMFDGLPNPADKGQWENHAQSLIQTYHCVEHWVTSAKSNEGVEELLGYVAELAAGPAIAETSVAEPVLKGKEDNCC